MDEKLLPRLAKLLEHLDKAQALAKELAKEPAAAWEAEVDRKGNHLQTAEQVAEGTKNEARDIGKELEGTAYLLHVGGQMLRANTLCEVAEW